MAVGLMLGLGTLAGKAAADRVQNIKKQTTASVPKNVTQQTAAANQGTAQSTPQVFSGNTSSVQNGGVGIRSGLVNMGYDNSRIGWDGANVTLDGKKFMTPDSVVDGTSYTSKDKLYSAVNDAVRAEGDSLQAATDFGAGKGVKNSVQWLGNGMVSIFGTAAKPVTITDDGKAIFRTSDLERMYNDWKQQSGYKTGADVFNQTQDKYGSMIDKALSDVMNRKAWDYDIENDEAYKAYRDMYTREGNRAMEDAIASMSGQTGGYVNSAALTAGGQAQNYYMQQLADRIPELQANDYNRYLGEQELLRQALNAAVGVSDDYYSKLYETSQADRNAINSAFDTNYNRNVTEREWQDAHAQNEQSLALSRQQQALNDYALKQAEAESAYYGDNARLGNESMRLSNEGMSLSNKAAQQNIEINQLNMQQQRIENAFANGRSRGAFTSEECAILGIPEGTSPYAAEQTYTSLMNRLEVEKQRALGQIDYDMYVKKSEYDAEQATLAARAAAEKEAYERNNAVNDKMLESYKEAVKSIMDKQGARAAQEYIDGLGADSATKAALAGYVGIPGAQTSEEYGRVYNQVVEKGKEYGYTDPMSISKDLVAGVVLSSDISDQTKNNLLNDFGVSNETIRSIIKRSAR